MAKSEGGRVRPGDENLGTPRTDPPPRTADYTPTAASVRRVSWGAIFAGAIVALVVQIVLNLLGLAIGLGAIDPATQQNPLRGLATGTGLWIILTAIVALFVGGWAAGRLAGFPRRIDGVLHGFVAWAVATFIMVYFVASGVGTMVSGAVGVVQEGFQFLGQGIELIAPEAGEIVQGIEGQVDREEIRSEALTILRQTGREDLEPENLSQRAEQLADTAQQAVGEAVQTPSQAGQEIQQAFDQLITEGEDVVEEVDREAAVNVLVNRTDMTPEEASQTVAEYESVVQEARTQLEQAAETVGDEAVQTTDDVIATMSSAALWAFLSLLVGAAAAAAGGAVGAPAHTTVTEGPVSRSERARY